MQLTMSDKLMAYLSDKRIATLTADSYLARMC